MTIDTKPRPQARGHNGQAPAKRVTVEGQRMVMLAEAEYDRLLQKADEWEPLMPEPLPNGNYPAVEYLRASLARKIIRDRRRLGLTQGELARRAGIRLATLCHVEQGDRSPSVHTVDKIDRALREAEGNGRTASGRKKRGH